MLGGGGLVLLPYTSLEAVASATWTKERPQMCRGICSLPSSLLETNHRLMHGSMRGRGTDVCDKARDCTKWHMSALTAGSRVLRGGETQQRLRGSTATWGPFGNSL